MEKYEETADPSLEWKFSKKLFNSGPDQILSSTAVSTSHIDGAVRILASNSEPRPISVPSLLQEAVKRAPNRKALAVKRDGVWVNWTYQDYLRDVKTVARAFIALGLEPFHSVCILGFNSPEWFMADLGAIFARGVAVGIYTTNSPDACAYPAIDSRVNIFVVEDDLQLAKILKIRDQLPDLKAIVQYTGQPSVPGILSWSDLMELGKTQPDTKLDERLSQICINQCCTLVYTSGTTGNPKGVLLSHDNMTSTAYSITKRCGLVYCAEEYISFLPLSHVAAQTADIYCPLVYCSTIFFGDKNALKGSLIETMKEVEPTKFFAVPRVWERMFERMQEIGKETKGLKRSLVTWAKKKGLEHNLKKMNGGGDNKLVTNHHQQDSLRFMVANKLVLSKVRAALGLRRCNIHLSGAAPISKAILEYFMSLNIVVTETYGLSECGGPHTMAVESAHRLGSSGKVFEGGLTKIGDPDGDGDGNGNGEILIGGRHVMMGYLHDPQKTSLAIDHDGWLHSEDLGHVDDDGYLWITGRLKELLVTAGGENVAPVPIEDRVKVELPCVSNAVVIGDRHKFLSLLLTFKTEIDKDTLEPLDRLLPVTIDWVKKNGDCDVITVKDVLSQLMGNQKLKRAIQAGIDGANSKAVSKAQRIQKWKILPTDFSIPGGELGPTLKLKRQMVYHKYDAIINEFYK